jgi:putative oxidoreductase
MVSHNNRNLTIYSRNNTKMATLHLWFKTNKLLTMKRFPFLSLPQSLTLLRMGVALLFVAHAAVRIYLPGSIASFSKFIELKGFPAGSAWVWAITIFEIAGGILLTLGIGTRWLAAGFIGLLIAGILLIHARLGWFVGEHGTGGCEYSAALILALLVVSAGAKEK